MKKFFKGVGSLLKTAGKVMIIGITALIVLVILALAGLLALIF